MHDVVVRMKDGRELRGPLYLWRPVAGFFSIVVDGEQTQIGLADVETAVQLEQRMSATTIEDVDLVARARREGWVPPPAPISMFVVYENPSDLPAGFAVRRWEVLPGATAPRELVGHSIATLTEARALVPAEFVCVGRGYHDEPHVVEVWL